MQLSDLPEEILIMIVKELDLWSMNSLYNSCRWIRNIVCMQGVVKHCNLSMNVMATARTLKLDFFKNISQSIIEVNMCCVPDLYKTTLIPALKRLKILKVLDVSYTNISIMDIIDINKACPSIKDITINIVFSNMNKVSNEILTNLQSVFAHYECICFVGSIENLLLTNLGLFLVAKAKLHSLIFSVGLSWTPNIMDQDFLGSPHYPYFDKFYLYLINWNLTDVNLPQFPVLSMLQFTKFEYIFILVDDMESKVFSSEMFYNYFKEQFNITVDTKSSIKLFGNVAMMLWNKEANTFDDIFFNMLTKHLKQYMVYYFVLNNDLHGVPLPANCEWLYTQPALNGNESRKDLMPRMKMARQAQPNLVLNYDVQFQSKQRLALTLLFPHNLTNAVQLKPNCEYLKKLTYLSLVDLGKCTLDFFNILFRCCDNLITINIRALPLSQCSSAIARSVPLSTSLKNIRLQDRGIDFKTLFSAFSQCPKLENFFVEDKSMILDNELADPGIVVEKCGHLYSVHIVAKLSQTTLTKTTQMFKKAKIRCDRPYLNVEVQQLKTQCRYRHNPFLDVYRINRIIIVK